MGKKMGFLENFENALDFYLETDHSESKPIPETDNMGREKFWEDLGRPEDDNLALKLFKEQCCDNCSCKSNNE